MSEVNQTTVEQNEADGLKESKETLRKMIEMKHKGMSSLVAIHLDTLSAIMLNGNGVSYAKKLQAAQALREAVLFALDFGLNVTNPKIRESGQPFAKESNTLSAVMVQALDTRMLILAERMNEVENEEQNNNNNEGDENV